ncbi:MAG: radical SAM protein [Caldilineaceae bacterium]|nr:radical SAM protein [Caldilineaceae bacterium]
MKYVYGPIPSRRLGRSLGVDPIPLKTCNWNCVYCQLGRSTPLTNERRDYIPPEAILAEVAEVLGRHSAGEIDYVSFVGSGEPTLHASLGHMIRAVKAMTAIPVAVITNGALLYREAVRRALLPADVVMPTVSAGTAEIFRRIHRPHADAGFERLIEGVTAFRAEYSGQLWVEVMLIRNLNDTVAALRDLAAVLRAIKPDQVHIVLPERPPAEEWVEPVDAEALLRVEAILGAEAHVVHPHVQSLDVSGYATPHEAIAGIVKRHPMSQAQLERALRGWRPEEVDAAIVGLAREGVIRPVDRLGVRFWVDAASVFPAAAGELEERAYDAR